MGLWLATALAVATPVERPLAVPAARASQTPNVAMTATLLARTRRHVALEVAVEHLGGGAVHFDPHEHIDLTALGKAGETLSFGGTDPDAYYRRQIRPTALQVAGVGLGAALLVTSAVADDPEGDLEASGFALLDATEHSAIQQEVRAHWVYADAMPPATLVPGQRVVGNLYVTVPRGKIREVELRLYAGDTYRSTRIAVEDPDPGALEDAPTATDRPQTLPGRPSL